MIELLNKFLSGEKIVVEYIMENGKTRIYKEIFLDKKVCKMISYNANNKPSTQSKITEKAALIYLTNML